MLADEELTQRIISAAIEVHRALGPGFLESVCEKALAVEFGLAELRFERQKVAPTFYLDRRIGKHRLDYPLEHGVVVEPKAVQTLEPAFFAIVRSCLKAAGLASGLSLNLAAMPSDIKRAGRESSAHNLNTSPA